MGASPERAVQDDYIARVEDLLRQHFRLLRDMFRFYAVQNRAGGSMVNVESLMRIFQDCKLRSKSFAAFRVEAIYRDIVKDFGEAVSNGLTPEAFVETIIRMAQERHAYRSVATPDQLQFFVDEHLAKHACKDVDSFFWREAYRRDVRIMLDSYDDELRLIFNVYAALDTTDDGADKLTTMNISEFKTFLKHCHVMDDKRIGLSAIDYIFDQIQHDSSEEAGNEQIEIEDGGADDEELSFSEFSDGLIAIVMYRTPNPFHPLPERLERFLLLVFQGLRRYWVKEAQFRHSHNPGVRMLMNALQKKFKVMLEEDLDT